jgi:hypothetical protein
MKIRFSTVLAMVLALLVAGGEQGCDGCGGATDTGQGAGAAAPIDAAPCDPNTDSLACGCCFTEQDVPGPDAIDCPPGVEPPDAAVLTLPVCDGGK